MTLRRALLVACWWVPLVAQADAPTTAQVHVDKATLLYKEGKFADALTELTTAYAIDPQPQLLYAMGQIEVKLGQCDDAAIYYKRFVAASPGAADATKEALDVCRKQAAEPPPTVVEPPTTPPPMPVPPPAQVAPAPHVSLTWYDDHTGDGLVAGGLVALLTSVVLYDRALADLDTADGAMTYAAQQSSVDSAHTLRTMSVLFGLAGLGLTGYGVFHAYGALADPPATVLVAPTPGGAAVSLSGRF